MHNQTDHADRPVRAGPDETLASRVESGGEVRAGEGPVSSTRYCTLCDGRHRTTAHAMPCTRCGGSCYEPR